MYCTVTDVKRALDFPSSDAPITDTDIEEFILDAEEEIEKIYGTKFGSIEETGTADGDYSTTTLSDSSLSMNPNQYIGYILWIYDGTNSGEYREITANTSTKITVSPAFSSATDNTSVFRIVKLGYIEETVDGTGTDEMFTNKQPLISLNELTIDSTSITPSSVYQYLNSGKLILSSDSEASYFTETYPQLIELKYIYGVYPLPRPIKRLCVCIAGIKTLTAQIAGTYDDFTTVGLPAGFSASKGEPYMNIRASLDYLQQEARGIVYGAGEGNQLGSTFNKAPVYRKFTIIG